MFKYYKKTHLEQFTEQLYIGNDILIPKNITTDFIADRLGISVVLFNSESLSHETNNGKKIIFLDDRKSVLEQREDFLHELCHLLRHAGNQATLPSPFVKYQEEDAELFVLYASLPYFMIEQLNLSPDHGQAIKQISNAFSTSIKLAKKRYDQILRREYEGTVCTKTSATCQPRKEVKSNIGDKMECAVYYDPSGTIDGPSQLIVTLDEWTLMNCREIELPIGERLPEVDLEEMHQIECIPALSSDVFCFDGIITLQVHQLLYRHGLKKNCFIIQMNDIEMKIARDQAMTRNLTW
ncbi:ImmA/IrrE family metallo-endopeptidase [Paenibacillus wynnii]|uniref:ImmA/IrrE family metallo-endopeptidase n=1 Tax=Paenibacillus wynnii TaxID=268407 RepID=UPI00069186FB|nr:ImmA/IrrE family metallo-endopeptidase [Paenibacillus wynnii]